uniref:carbohydrate-binding protein n=1 Tax=Coprococcus catus TaxID=116085 RepID=UPI0022E58568|nr:carbohydrate-binding protein [Coprococcus catus]
MSNNGLRLSEEQVWILRRVIEAAVQLLTNEEDIKKCVSLFEKWEAGKVYLSLKKIRYNGHIYKCLLPHTSAEDKVPGNKIYWQLVV